MAEFFLKGEEADRLADTAQGNVEGAVIGGGVEEAVQAGLKEVQLVEEGGELGLVLMAALQVQTAGEMPGVAVERGGGEAELGGQGAEGHAG